MTVPTYRPKIWLEAWTRPGHATFGKVINDVPVGRGSITARGNGVGEGSAELPSNYSRLDEILKPDPTTPANMVSSLMRVFQEDVVGPIAEWLPAEMTGADSKNDTTVTVKGADIFSLLGHARLEAWDWDGTDDHHSLWPDWIWGGRNLLGELESVHEPAVTRIYTDASGGTFTIGVSFNGGAIQNTAAIAFNASAATVDTELTALSNVDSIEVSGSGTATDPWRIQTVTPEGEYVFSTNSAGLTPGGSLAFQDRESIGKFVPQGWTTSFNPVNNLSHGQVNIFRASMFVAPDPAAPACDTSGVAIMFDGDAGFFPGIQKIVPVKPGGRYYATATAYPQGGSGTYRFVIRDLFENGIAAEPNFDSGTTITANTWTTFDDLTSVVIPDDVDRVIVRFAAVGGANPPPTFVTCLELREGMPPTTWGDIWEQLHADATSDHASRRVWQIGATAASYLTLDFTELVDSAGAAWTHPEVSITLKRGQNYLRVASECFKQGYEGRIVPNSVTAGTWKFQLYNPGTAGTVLNAASSPVIMGGRDVIKRDVRKFLPTFTDWAVEAGGQNIARERSTTAITALGRIEGYTPNQDLGTLTEASQAASTALTAGLQQSQSLTYTVVGVQGAYPLVDYDVFDTINVDDPPDVPKVARRIKQIQLAWDKDGVQATIQLGAESYVGVGAIYEGVNVLLKEFKAIRDRPDESTDILNYFPGLLRPGSLPPIVFAAVDTNDTGKALANYIGTGVNDEAMIRQAILDLAQPFDDATGTYGTFLFLDGTYTFDASCLLDTDGFGRLQFVGDGLPRFLLSYNTAPAPLFLMTGGGGNAVEETIRFRNIKFDGANLSNGHFMRQTTLTAKATVHVAECVFKDFNLHIWWSERQAPYFVHDSEFYTCDPTAGMFHFDAGTTARRIIHHNTFISCTGNMVSGFAFSDHTHFHGNWRDQGTLTLNALGGVVYNNNLGF
jgi:hypothetical protein